MKEKVMLDILKELKDIKIYMTKIYDKLYENDEAGFERDNEVEENVNVCIVVPEKMPDSLKEMFSSLMKELKNEGISVELDEI